MFLRKISNLRIIPACSFELPQSARQPQPMLGDTGGLGVRALPPRPCNQPRMGICGAGCCGGWPRDANLVARGLRGGL
jgi:hypothetical protein